MTEMEYLPFFHDDEAFARNRALQKACKPLFGTKRTDQLMELLELALQNSLLPISDEEKTETTKLLQNFEPMLWQILEEQIGDLGSGDYQEPNENLQTKDLLLESVGTKACVSNGKYMGLQYRDMLKFLILKLGSGEVEVEYYKALKPYRMGRSLDNKYKHHQPFVSKNYERDILVLRIFLGILILFLLFFFGFLLSQVVV